MIAKNHLHTTRTGAILAFAASVALVVTTAAPASAATVAVYNSIPSTLPANYVSLGYQAQQTAEFGDQVTLSGTNRILDNITVGFSSWACEDGQWNLGDCVTSPDATFDHPITLNIYGINTADATLPGALLATVTKTVTVPYRPSSDPTNCTTTPTQWWNGSVCSNGLAFTANFDFSAADVVLPNDIIVTIAFNTQTWGAEPTGTAGPYTALNLGLSQAAPTIGAEDSSRVFWNTATSAYYGDSGPTGVLREALNSPDLASQNGAYGGLFMTINASEPAPALANTGVDTAAMMAGTWIAGGILAIGLALFGFAAYRKRAARN